MSTRVFVCCAVQDQEEGCRVHRLLRARRFEPVTRWIEEHDSNFDLTSPARLTQAIREDDDDLAEADIVLVLSSHAQGIRTSDNVGEALVQAGLAIADGKRIVWLGSKTLSAARPEVLACVDSLDQALDAMERIRDAMEQDRPALRGVA